MLELDCVWSSVVLGCSLAVWRPEQQGRDGKRNQSPILPLLPPEVRRWLLLEFLVETRGFLGPPYPTAAQLSEEKCFDCKKH